MLILRCFGEAMLAQGMQGLMGLVPYGNVVYGVAKETLEIYRKRCEFAQLNADVGAMLQASQAEIAADADAILLELAPDRSKEELLQLETWLTHIPSIARQSMKRPADPTGKSVAPQLNLSDPQQLMTLLPQRKPRFQVGDAVPGNAQWQLVELLGSGGFGEVWLARHTFLDEQRAYKFCLDEQARDRLLYHEGEVVKRVMQASTHVNKNEHGIVPLVDAYLHGEVPWLAYEYVAGGDLSGVARELSELPLAERATQAMQILADLAEVIGRFHRLPTPIIHRDLKPANILVQRHGDRWLLKVTDFGISHVAAQRNLQQATVSTPQLSLGETYRGSHTPMYASPQQERGAKADPRDDVHALGVIGFQLLHGDVSKTLPRNDKWIIRLGDCGLSTEVLKLLSSCWDDEVDERPADAMALRKDLPLKPSCDIHEILPPIANQPSKDQIQLEGILQSRDAVQPNIRWTTITNTPAEIVLQPGLNYKLKVSVDVDDSDLAILEQQPLPNALYGIDFSGCRLITYVGLYNLRAMPMLCELNLSKCVQLTDTGLSYIQGLTKLCDLKLMGCYQLTDNGIAYLQGLIQLQELVLNGCNQLTDSGMVYLSNFTQMQRLNLRDCNKVTDNGLDFIMKMPDLQELNLSNCLALTDIALNRLHGLKHLHTLNLIGCEQLTDTGLANLQVMTSIQHLHISRCPKLTDAGLSSLHGMSALRKLDIWDSRQLTDKGILPLQKALPQCVIKHRYHAYGL